MSISIIQTIASLFPAATAAVERRLQRPNKRVGLQLTDLGMCGSVGLGKNYGAIAQCFSTSLVSGAGLSQGKSTHIRKAELPGQHFLL